MEDLELFKKRINSYITKAYEGGVALLPFLDEAQISVLEQEMKWHSQIAIKYAGGIEAADRLRYIIIPEGYDNVDFKIVVYKIIYNKKYYDLHHRSVLGSLMSLGIKRECIGDIVITDDKDVYFACTSEISVYIKESFNFVGKAPIQLEEYSDPVYNVPKYEDKLYFLASLRLDVAVAAIYNMSRSESLELIRNSLVFVNHILILNPSYIVKFEDEISVRHKGKFKISEIGNTTKSGRIAVKLSKRI